MSVSICMCKCWLARSKNVIDTVKAFLYRTHRYCYLYVGQWWTLGQSCLRCRCRTSFGRARNFNSISVFIYIEIFLLSLIFLIWSNDNITMVDLPKDVFNVFQQNAKNNSYIRANVILFTTHTIYIHIFRCSYKYNYIIIEIYK